MRLVKILSFMAMIILISLNAFNCGSDPAAEGEKAFQSANYNLAIKHYLEAKKENPAQESAFDEKIALSYMLRGQDLYGRTKNVKSFSGNFEKALDYIPENPTPEFRKNFSNILYAIANAYMNARPENEIQKEEYLNKTIDYLEEALFNDENNTQATELIEKIKVDNFQKMLNKGKDFFSRASRTKNSDYYINAEYYLQRAAYFDISNKEAEQMLSKTRKKTLSILNNREDFAMAIADMSRQANSLILDLTIKNYATNPVELNLKNFKVIDNEGKTYNVSTKIMAEKFKDKQLINQKLDELKSIDGIIVFSVPKAAKLDYLGYQLNEDETAKKYFP